MMPEPSHDLSKLDADLIDGFIKGFFGDDSGGPLAEGEEALLQTVVHSVRKRASEFTFVIGLAVDFAVLAEQLSEYEGAWKEFGEDLTFQETLSRFELKTARSGQPANTLSLRPRSAPSAPFRGIRAIENRVVDLFHHLNRTGYPSAAPYNTGQWERFPEFLQVAFRLSSEGRRQLVRSLLEFGASFLQRNTFFGPEKRVPLFRELVESYPRRGPQENAGLTFQAISYGFFAADRPQLEIVADKVRTGSARQKRFGDIDCYRGLELALSIEVKDKSLDIPSFSAELGRFTRNAVASGVFALVVADRVSEELLEKLDEMGVVVMQTHDLVQTVSTWDWPKQDAAVGAMLHYLSHIEQNSVAANRLLAFIESRDASHDSLRYLGNVQ